MGVRPSSSTPAHCRHCQAPLTPGEKFCGTCGAPVQVDHATPAEGRVCHRCRTPLVGEESFCGNCGAPVEPPAATPPPDAGGAGTSSGAGGGPSSATAGPARPSDQPYPAGRHRHPSRAALAIAVTLFVVIGAAAALVFWGGVDLGTMFSSNEEAATDSTASGTLSEVTDDATHTLAGMDGATNEEVLDEIDVDEPPEPSGGIDALVAAMTYPQQARDAGVEGMVMVELTVDTRGRVVDPVVVQDPGAGCGEAAVTAVRNATFAPARRDGKAVAVRTMLPIPCAEDLEDFGEAGGEEQLVSLSPDLRDAEPRAQDALNAATDAGTPPARQGVVLDDVGTVSNTFTFQVYRTTDWVAMTPAAGVGTWSMQVPGDWSEDGFAFTDAAGKRIAEFDPQLVALAAGQHCFDVDPPPGQPEVVHQARVVLGGKQGAMRVTAAGEGQSATSLFRYTYCVEDAGKAFLIAFFGTAAEIDAGKGDVFDRVVGTISIQ